MMCSLPADTGVLLLVVFLYKFNIVGNPYKGNPFPTIEYKEEQNEF